MKPHQGTQEGEWTGPQGFLFVLLAKRLENHSNHIYKNMGISVASSNANEIKLKFSEPQELASRYEKLSAMLFSKDSVASFNHEKLRKCVLSALSSKIPCSDISNKEAEIVSQEKWGNDYYPKILNIIFLQNKTSAGEILSSANGVAAFAKRVMGRLEPGLMEIGEYEDLMRDELMCFLSAAFDLQQKVEALNPSLRAVTKVPSKKN